MVNGLFVRIRSKETEEVLLKCPLSEKVSSSDIEAIKTECEQCGIKVVDSIVPESSRLASNSTFWTVLWDDYNYVALEVGIYDQYLYDVTVAWDEGRHAAEVVWTDDIGGQAGI